MAGRGSHPMTAKHVGTQKPREVYHGILRQFDDGLWGALFFEIGVMAMARSEEEAIRQAIESLDSELASAERGDIPVGPLILQPHLSF